MREIKFRVFDPDTKTMELVGAIDWDKDCAKIITCNTQETKHYFGYHKDLDSIIMQYTGLKDKNGKEIYEGDIIPHYSTEKIMGIVKYGEYKMLMREESHVGFYLEFKDDLANQTTRLDLTYWAKVSEVIGNIYENSELIGRTLAGLIKKMIIKCGIETADNTLAWMLSVHKDYLTLKSEIERYLKDN